MGLTGLVFLLIATLYGVKLLKHRQAVTKELNHPVNNFFPASSIGLILLSIAPVNPMRDSAQARFGHSRDKKKPGSMPG